MINPFNFFKNNTFLGIDLGSLNMKIVEFIKKDKSLYINNFGSVRIINFNEISSNSQILEENISKILNDFLSELKINTKVAYFNLPAVHLFSSNFFIPDIAEKNLHQVIYFEAQKQIPLTLDEVELYYRYYKLETENQPKQWLVYVIAVPKSYIRRIENIANLSKLKILGFYPEYLNFEPFFKNISGNFLVIDIGHVYTLISFVKDGKVLYGTRLKIGGYNLLDNLVNVINYTEEEILDLLDKKGVNFLPEEKDIKFVVDSFLINLFGFIEKEIDRIENTYLLRIEKIYWTGKISVLPGFDNFLLNNFGKYYNEVLTPFDFVKGEKFYSLGKKSTVFIQSIGTVLNLNKI